MQQTTRIQAGGLPLGQVFMPFYPPCWPRSLAAVVKKSNLHRKARLCMRRWRRECERRRSVTVAWVHSPKMTWKLKKELQGFLKRGPYQLPCSLWGRAVAVKALRRRIAPQLFSALHRATNSLGLRLSRTLRRTVAAVGFATCAEQLVN